ncbi:hypothetical protein [Thalassotalea mangrovi]|uniref:Tetratricopeptide repeat protein n=1 Tax=Thalassotalea mangrovi TaxID=2572245 RepID=A0A4U1B4B6_9GAMM|nr:hypothetical protein [Thalassotalea mangrovi]TKB44831.1 hypothetical protein E8M12_10525 [Thalassotalea mangrovi]
MKIVVLLSLIFPLISCTAVPDEEPVLLHTNISQSQLGSNLSFEELDEEVNRLNSIVGMYPPRFEDELHREQTFMIWLELVDVAKKFHQQLGEEKTYYMLTELFRMGYNMQVPGSGQNAMDYLSACLTTYPTSVACNFSATYFYLTAGKYYLHDAEKSLQRLRAHYLPAVNLEVESGYVFLYLFLQDEERAVAQIDRFIDAFPDSQQADEFNQIKKALAE